MRQIGMSALGQKRTSSSGCSALGFCWEPTLRRIFINGVWKFARQSGKQFVSRQARLLRQRLQNFRSNSLLDLSRCYRFVGPCAYTGLGLIALTALLETIHKFTEPATQDAAGSGTAETAAQLVEEAADAPLRGDAWLFIGAPEQLRELVPILIARNGEQAE